MDHPLGRGLIPPKESMKSLKYFFLATIVAGTAFADPPRSPSPSRYKVFYEKSAFTDPPPEEIEEEIPSDLPDWVLVGLSKYVDGVKVKLMNKKDRTRVTIPSREATDMGFSIKEVKQDRNFIDEAVVTVMKGGKVGEVRFDPQYLVLKKVAGPAGGNNKMTPAQIAAAKKAAAAAKAKSGSGSSNPKIPVPSPKTPGRQNGPPTPGTTPGAVPQPSANTPRTSTSGGNPTRSSSGNDRRRWIPRK